MIHHFNIKRITTILFLLFAATACSSHKYIVEASRTNIDLPELKADIGEIRLQKINFTKDRKNIYLFCLNETELKKLYSNISIIKSKYNEIVAKYKRATDNYNVLKKIAYEQ